MDVTEHLALIEGLGFSQPLGPDELAPPPELRRHEFLAEPTEHLAEELFVDLAWLAEVRDLLDERRQVIFSGRPAPARPTSRRSSRPTSSAPSR